MAYLQFHGKQYSVPAEGLSIGCYDGAALRLPGDDASVRAVVALAADGSAVIRRDATDALILVNGVRLGVEPSPILHGDKVEMAGDELRYGDDNVGGSTQFVSSAQVAEMARAKGAAPAKPTLARGGRLVSLTDGREYAVPDDGITIGREVGNDIVIPSSEVSRKHAELVPMPGGYLLTDHSTNGMFVNGVRVAQTQVLGRGDVLKLGPEEFRFYADTAKPAPVSPLPGVVPAPPVAPPVAPAVAPTPASLAAPTPPVSAEPVTAPAPARAAPPPAAPPPATAPRVAASAESVEPVRRTPLATLEIINEGPLKGTKFEIHSALTNVGRGAHNDVVLADESISDSHAKIQRRDGGWFIVDQGSTNGTYVGDRRVQGEQHVTGAPDVRFGGIKMTFRPRATAADEGGGTRAIAAVSADQLRTPAAPKPAAVAEAKKKGCAAVIAFMMALTVAGASLLAVLLTSGR